MVLLLTNDEVRASVDMKEAIDVVEAGFREEAEGGLHQPHRLNMPAGEPGKSFLRLGPCVMHHSGWMGFKAMNLAKDIGVRYQVHIYKMATGELCSIMDGQFLTTIRTGATSGVATKYLARKTPGLVGVLGSGQESMMQLEAMRALGLVSAARIYSPTPEKREALAAFFRDKHGLDVKAVATAREAVEGCDSVVGAVNSAQPVILGEWLRPGMHINSVGTARPTQREIDHEVFRRAEITVVDTREGVFKEAGDGVLAVKDGIVNPDAAFELSQLVVGKAPARTSDSQITLFKSVGTAVQDIAVAVKAYENARARGLGRDMGTFPYILEKNAQKPYN